ncbi:MAG: hypothetical protein ACRDZ6_09290 [Acidimicrobiales bacterium]
MKKIWKGFAIGGLAGVVAGLVVFVAKRGARLASGAGRHAADVGSKAASRARSVAATGTAKLPKVRGSRAA